METIKDFFKNINYRLSSPLIFSFVVSWLFCNWQVPISLLFYSHTLSQVECLQDYLDFIKKNVSLGSGVLCPLGGAVFYTFIYPYIAKEIRDFQTKREVAAEASELEIRKGSSIPIDKYLDLRTTLANKQDLLEKIIKAESSTQVELQNKINEVNKLVLDKQQLNEALTGLQATVQDYNRIKNELRIAETLEEFFPGNWICEFCLVERPSKIQSAISFEPFSINRSKYIVQGKLKFAIKHIRYVEFMNSLIFHKIDENNPQQGDCITTLTRVNNNLWVGIEKLANQELSYVRYYPESKVPEYFPRYVYLADLNNLEAQQNFAFQVGDGLRLIK